MLSLWVRQKAWFSASIEIAKGKKVNRGSYMRKNGFKICFPEITEGANLKQWIDELGFCESGMNGPTQLTHKEIESWANLTGIELTPTEAIMLRHFSNEFVSQYHKSDIDCEPPYSEEEDSTEEMMGLRLLSLLDA